MSFDNLDLLPELLKALEEEGYENPTPIQVQAIPIILEGSDLRASAQTGTGKTAAFILPALNKLAQSPGAKGKGPRVLILVPTRELAMQVANKAVKYSKYLPRMRTVCIYGGAPYPIQYRELSRPYEILVATPGRLIDHMERGRIDFSRLELLILDEADRMLDMGFIEPVEQIAAATPSDRQTLMFSATLRGPVMNLAKNLLRHPKEVNVAAEHEKHENIEQKFYLADNIAHKYKLLDHFLSDDTINQVIVFTATKRHADQLVDQLMEGGHQVAALHGDMNQRQRTRTITAVRNGKIRVLIATDVAARGIDVQTISHVINFDLPMSEEDYVHRIGRTGRAGASGVAISFATPKEMSLIRRIERYTGHTLPPQVVEGLEPKASAASSSYRSRGQDSRPRWQQKRPDSRWKSEGRRESSAPSHARPRYRSEESSHSDEPRRERSEESRRSEPRKPRTDDASRAEEPRRARSDEPRKFRADEPKKFRSEEPKKFRSDEPKRFRSDESRRSDEPKKFRSDEPRKFRSEEGRGYEEPRERKWPPRKPTDSREPRNSDGRAQYAPRGEKSSSAPSYRRSEGVPPYKRAERSERSEGSSSYKRSEGPRERGPRDGEASKGRGSYYSHSKRPSGKGPYPAKRPGFKPKGPTSPKPNFGSYSAVKPRKKAED